MADLLNLRDEGAVDTAADDPSLEPVVLELLVCDPEVIGALRQYDNDDDARTEFALQALRIGVLAMRNARGQLDGNVIQRECERMLTMLASQLREHGQGLNERLTGVLGRYFDPASGAFTNRVQRLVERDGELEQVLRRQIGAEDSQLCKTLAEHFGAQSQLMRMLSPSESTGVLAAFRETLAVQLTQQRETVLREFSLDNSDGALCRLVSQLTERHGKLSDALHVKIDEVVKEFSLDQDNSALSRLVKNVTQAQQTISLEFSLDNDQSALSRLKQMLERTSATIDKQLTLDDDASSLARLKRELLTILDTHAKTAREFQEEVKVSLAALSARRAEAQRGTQHGLDFEDAVFEYIVQHAQQAGDVADRTGLETGLMSHCKKGDYVITLGPDSAASGARIVVEAKEDRSYDVRAACDELQLARQNRQAQVGLFVFSSKTAPPGLEPPVRYGHDVLVVWDAADADSNALLRAGLALARGLCIRANKQSAAQEADFDAIDKAIAEIGKRAEALEKVSKWAKTIQNNGAHIIKHVSNSRKNLVRQVAALEQHIADLRRLTAEPGSDCS